MNEDKEVTRFMLQAIEKLSLAVLNHNYEPDEINEIYNQAGIYLFELR